MDFGVKTEEGGIITQHAPSLDRRRQMGDISGFEGLNVVHPDVGVALDISQG